MKKIFYIILVLFAAILHTIVLNMWLSEDNLTKNISMEQNRISVPADSASIESQRSIGIFTNEYPVSSSINN